MMPRVKSIERDERPSIHAHNLYSMEVRTALVDESVLLRLNISDEVLWVRVHRTDFPCLGRIPS